MSWIVNESLATLPDLCSDVDELILFRRDDWNSVFGIWGFFGFLRSLKRRSWDYVIDVQGLFRSGLCAWFAGDGSNVYGFADAREFASTFYARKIVVPDLVRHAVDRNLYLLNECLGSDELYDHPRFNRDDGCVAEIDDLLDGKVGSSSIVTVAVGSRWESKNWPPEFFAAVMDRVAYESNASIVLVGSPSEVVIGEKVMSASRSKKFVDLIGKTTLGGMVELIRRSEVLMTNDSGPMHVAAAFGIPTVTFFGPTSPERTGPYGSIHVIFESKLDCSPCYNRKCPLSTQICLRDTVTVDMAADAVLSKLTGEDK